MIEAGQPRVIVVGAGPCGALIANLLGVYGVATLIIDRNKDVIPYPRAVGVDDESLRALQAAGLAERAHSDMIQNQLLRYFDSTGRPLIDVAPSDRPFGWPRRNSFIQPMLEEVLREGFNRFPHVEFRNETELVGYSENDRVTATLRSSDGREEAVTVDYIVGADGGSSTVRQLAGIDLVGSTLAARWLVIDIKNSGIHAPYAGNYISSKRPYVSIDLPYGYRRFEFRLNADETAEQATQPEFVSRLISERFRWNNQLNISGAPRVYSHHSRIAEKFRSGRIFLAGDAAHLQPPWFGQGMNSGIRDAANIAWKLAAVTRGEARDSLLDTYEIERRGHATEMVKLATTLGRIYSPKSAAGEKARSVFFRTLRHFPQARDYVTKMKFKPMPRYLEGVVAGLNGSSHDRKNPSPIGRMLIQPDVELTDGTRMKLDEALGDRFALVGLRMDPRSALDENELAFWEGLGARFVQINRSRIAKPDSAPADGLLVLDDVEGGFRDWEAAWKYRILFVRPDRYLAAATLPENMNAISHMLQMTIGVGH